MAVDLNGDGKLDLVTANNGSGTVSVLLNQGTPGRRCRPPPAPRRPASKHSSQLFLPILAARRPQLGDGKPDLAVANYPTINSVSVLPGNGDGTFQAATTYSVSNNPISITAGDFNGDGITDLVATGQRLMGNVTCGLLLHRQQAVAGR